MTTSETLPLPFPGWDLRPTPAMLDGRQTMWQCAWCGLVAIVPTAIDGTRRPLNGKPCPACDTPEWWHQDPPLAGWRKV